MRALAYLLIGDFDGLRQHACDPTEYGEGLLMQGRYAQIIADMASDPILKRADGRLRLRALLATKQYAQIQIPCSDWLIDGLTLRGRGRMAEAVQRHPGDPVLVAIAAVVPKRRQRRC